MQKERKLLFSVTSKDFDIQTFASGGPGGQHQNKTESGVRIVHRASGAKGESREHRSQHMNKQTAFQRLLKTDAWLKWHRAEVARRLGAETAAEQAAEAAMAPHNLRIEARTENGWSRID